WFCLRSAKILRNLGLKALILFTRSKITSEPWFDSVNLVYAQQKLLRKLGLKALVLFTCSKITTQTSCLCTQIFWSFFSCAILTLPRRAFELSVAQLRFMGSDFRVYNVIPRQTRQKTFHSSQIHTRFLKTNKNFVAYL